MMRVPRVSDDEGSKGLMRVHRVWVHEGSNITRYTGIHTPL